jgi:hypothetical protein
MTVTVYRSSDSSAPTLSGTVGDLVNVLDKCLVAGYGSKTAAGWTKPYTGTNAAVFRMGGGNQFYLDVNDNGPGSATAQEARVRGYETMSAVATGTGPFPTVAQLAAGVIIRKSVAASGTARVWTLVADDRTFYLFNQAGDTAGQWYGFGFGDFYSYTTGTDNYRTMIFGHHLEATPGASGSNEDRTGTNLVGANASHYVARSYTGLGGSVQWTKVSDDPKKGSSGFLGGALALPHPVDGNIWLVPLHIAHTTAIRGKLRGYVDTAHTVASIADQDTASGAGIYAGHTFLFFKTTPGGGIFTLDVTGPWDTN